MSSVSVNGGEVNTHSSVTTPSVTTGHAGLTPGPSVTVSEVGPQGPTGPAGDTGPAGPQGSAGGSSFTYSQMSASTVWTITHNLGRYPPVTIVNEEGDEVFGDVHYASNEVVTVTFSAAFSGIAYLG